MWYYYVIRSRILSLLNTNGYFHLAEVHARCTVMCMAWLYIDSSSEQWADGTPVDYDIAMKAGNNANGCSAKDWSQDGIMIRWSPCSENLPVLCQEFLQL